MDLFERFLFDIFLAFSRSAFARIHAQLYYHVFNIYIMILWTFNNTKNCKRMDLALFEHNQIREKHLNTDALKLTEDLTIGAKEYAEHLRLV